MITIGCACSAQLHYLPI